MSGKSMQITGMDRRSQASSYNKEQSYALRGCNKWNLTARPSAQATLHVVIIRANGTLDSRLTFPAHFGVAPKFYNHRKKAMSE